MNSPICITKIQPFVDLWGTPLQLHPDYPILFDHPFMGKKNIVVSFCFHLSSNTKQNI